MSNIKKPIIYLIFGCIFLIHLPSYARKGGEQSGSNDLKSVYRLMDGKTAYLSLDLEKRIRPVRLPGFDRSLDPNSMICLEDGLIRTFLEYDYCETWQVRTKGRGYGSSQLEFTSLKHAIDFSRSKNGLGRPTCINEVHDHYYVNPNGTELKCVYWHVDKKDSTSARRFTNFAAAMRYSDDSSNAKGLPYCQPRNLQMVEIKAQTHYAINYFAPGTDIKLGKPHHYRYFSCNQLPRESIEEFKTAGGEQSGSNVKKPKTRNL